MVVLFRSIATNQTLAGRVLPEDRRVDTPLQSCRVIYGQVRVHILPEDGQWSLPPNHGKSNGIRA